MAALSPSTSGPVYITRSCASSFCSSSPATEPGWLENVETEGRRRRDGVHGIFHFDYPDFSALILNRGWRCGWEPGAILNWLALAGWGVKHDHSEGGPSSAKAAPTSTTVMTLQEMIQEVGRCVVRSSKPASPFQTVRFIRVDSPEDDFGPIETGISE